MLSFMGTGGGRLRRRVSVRRALVLAGVGGSGRTDGLPAPGRPHHLPWVGARPGPRLREVI